jgi:hypothetical protein
MEEGLAIAKAEEAIEDAKRTFGEDDLKVAECLEHCVKLMKAAKLRLLDAANMEARAKAIRRQNFERSVLTSQVDRISGKDPDANTNAGTSTDTSIESQAQSKSDGWTRPCPYCGALIERHAILCRYCNASDMQSIVVASEMFCDDPEKRLCPFCGGKLARDATVCWFCSAKLPPLSSGVAPSAAAANKKYMKPMQAALLSGLTLNGAAQIRLGQAKKGSAMILGSIVLGTLTMGFSVLLTAPIAAYDAYMIASKLQKGKSVDTWEFF